LTDIHTHSQLSLDGGSCPTKKSKQVVVHNMRHNSLPCLVIT
jgi:histidinol phosphatase-like PHP family hydrolase